MIQTTPKTISEQITAFCTEIDPTHEPVYVPVKPDSGAEFNECFRSVKNYIAEHTGDMQHGWIIWELPNEFLEAEFHSVWISPSGEFIDVTPKPDGETRILFVTDSTRVFEGRLVENRKKPLIHDDSAQNMLWIEHNRFLIKQKHYFDGEVNHEGATAEFSDWLNSQEARSPKIGRNSRCVCGSQKKFKICCGTWWKCQY